MWPCLFQMNHKILIRTENIDWSDHKSNLVPKLLSVPPKLQILPPHATLARSKEIFSLMYLQFTQVGFFLKFQFDSFPSSVTSLPSWRRESIVLPPFPEPPLPWATCPIFHFFNNFRHPAFCYNIQHGRFHYLAKPLFKKGSKISDPRILIWNERGKRGWCHTGEIYDKARQDRRAG